MKTILFGILFLTTFLYFLLHFRYCYHALKWNIIAITNNHVEANLCLFSPMHNLFQLRNFYVTIFMLQIFVSFANIVAHTMRSQIRSKLF